MRRSLGQVMAIGATPPRTIRPEQVPQTAAAGLQPFALHVYMRADVAAPGNIAAHIEHARALRWSIGDGCLIVTDGVGSHWYPLTSVARWTIAHQPAA